MPIVQQQRQASVRCCEAVGVLAAVGVFANAGQQNLIEWLKGVRRYELSGCLRQAIVRSNDPGGVMQRAIWIKVMRPGVQYILRVIWRIQWSYLVDLVSAIVVECVN